jgi:hypothetical protein
MGPANLAPVLLGRAAAGFDGLPAQDRQKLPQAVPAFSRTLTEETCTRKHVHLGPTCMHMVCVGGAAGMGWWQQFREGKKGQSQNTNTQVEMD